MERPNFLTERHIDHLESLKFSQLNDMLFSVPHLLQRFPELNAKQAQQALLFWLNKSAAHSQNEIYEFAN